MKLSITSFRQAARLAVWLAVAAVAGALAGTVTSLLVIPTRLEVVTPMPKAPAAATSTVAEPPLMRLEPRSVESLTPPAFLQSRSSPVVAVYRKPKGATPEDRTLMPEALLGHAVSLTSDGWFVIPQSVLGNLRLSDVVLWRNGQTFSLQSGVADHLSGTVFVNGRASEMPAPAFGDAINLVPGSVLWIERRASSLVPSIVTSLSEQLPATEPASSEIAVRRVEINGVMREGDRGAPVWNGAGALMGILDAAPGQPQRFIPISGISTSFISLLTQKKITHATLGVRAVDLTAWRFDGGVDGRGNYPMRGALLKDTRGKPAVIASSPAAKAKLKAGDVILRVERDILDGTSDLGEILSAYRPGSSVVLRIRRDDREIDVPVTLGSAETSEPLK